MLQHITILLFIEMLTSLLKVDQEKSSISYKMKKDSNSTTNVKMNGIYTASDTHTQEYVYNQIAKPIMESALCGYSGTIIAYGPTNVSCCVYVCMCICMCVQVCICV